MGMKFYSGIDVSLDSVSVCIVDETGHVKREAKVACEPDALVAWFRGLDVALERIGPEAGPLSQWLHAGIIGDITCKRQLAISDDKAPVA
jgi:hypothetical protein